MFSRNKTVFILGAGASWHYGYPTGEELVKKVVAKAHLAAGHFSNILNSRWTNGILDRPKYISRKSPNPITTGINGMREEWKSALDECIDLIKRLESVDPLVIDYFLGQNPHLGDIGKFLIAWVLLECEAVFLQYRVNNNRLDLLRRPSTPSESNNVPVPTLSFLQETYKDNWYRFLLHKLVTGCETADALLDNKVTFVTFNYDVSLEYQLFSGLSALDQFATNNIIDSFFSTGRFIHIYGKVRVDPIAQPSDFNLDLLDGPAIPRLHTAQNPEDIFPRIKSLFDTIYEASKGIKTIAPFEKIADPTVERAQRAIEDASCVYVLGYGFDANNSKLLNLSETLALEKTHKTVLFTNFSNYNVVNKSASRIMFGSPDRLLSDKPAFLGSHTGEYFCEKSTRNVYDALAVDFDNPEEHLLSTTPI